MIWIGTSGYQYPEWKGSFYPEDMPTSKMLPYYSERFPTVEINYTFRRMPTDKVLSGWAEVTPDPFAFTLKAHRRITHDARLVDCSPLVETLCSRSTSLGAKLGVLLFQLPPYFKKDVSVLEEFLDVIPEGTRSAFEFRSKSWHSDDVFDALKKRNAALCIADSEKMTTPAELTAGYAYFRLRDEGYKRTDIERWSETVAQASAGLADVFVYFKHEDKGLGAEFGRTMMEVLGLATPIGEPRGE